MYFKQRLFKSVHHHFDPTCQLKSFCENLYMVQTFHENFI